MKTKKGSIIIPIIIAVLILAVLGIGIFALKINPFKQGSQKTIENAISKLVSADSFQAEGTLKIEINEKEEKSVNAEISLREEIDNSNKEMPKCFIDTDIKVGMEGVMIEGKAEAISIGKEVYFMIKSVPSIPFISGIDLSSLKNQWYKVEEKTFEGIIGSQEKIDEKQLIEDLKKIFLEKEIFGVEKNFGEEEFSGLKAEHYSAVLKKKAVKEIIPEFLELMPKYLSGEEKDNYEKQLESFLAGFTENFESAWKKIEPIKFDFWIGGGYLKKIKFEKEFSYDSEISEKTEKAKINIEMIFSDFNKKFSIEPPKESKPIESILSTIFLPENQ